MSKYVFLYLIVQFSTLPFAYSKGIVSQKPYPFIEGAKIVELELLKKVPSKPNQVLPPDILRGYVLGPKNGPIYLLLGGITTNAGTFHETAKALANKGARVYAINPIYQGSGVIKSEPHPDRMEKSLNYNLFKMTEHIYELLPLISEANGNRPINVVAHSLQGIVMRLAMLGLSFDKHSNFIIHPERQQLIQKHLESLTLYFTPSFESLEDLKSNGLNMVRVEGGLFLLIDAIPKYYEIRKRFLELIEMQKTQNFGQFEAVTSKLWQQLEQLTKASRHGGFAASVIHKAGAHFLKQIVFGLFETSFHKQVSTSKGYERFQSDVANYLKSYDLERDFLQAEEALLVPTIKKLNRVPLFKLIGSFAQGFMNIDHMNSKQIIEFLRSTMSEEVHLGIRDHLLKIAKTGQLQTVATLESLPFDIAEKYFEYFKDNPRSLDKVVYYADYNDPLAPGKKIVQEAKKLSTPYVKNDCGHCGAANPISAQVMVEKLLKSRSIILEKTKYAMCLSLF